MRSQTLIAVADVAKASRWYQTLLECDRIHDGTAYSRLAMPGESDFFLQLHVWNAHDHPNLGDPMAAAHGYGVLLWFLVDDFAAAVTRAQQMKAEIVTPPHVNPLAHHQECWLRDLDGYIVVIASRPEAVVSSIP